ncbi:MAG: hypothetical protein IJS54_04720 [Desulfovibrio sp.]|nr:hypothetical protein [Desulfovibrio sp.]
MKIAVYVLGDHNIIYPALVLFTSLKKHNDFDFFLYTESETMNEEQIRLCQDLNIRVENIQNEEYKRRISVFSNFKRWPKELFLNYVIPYYLNDLGYDYAIKMDYDILCLDTYKLDEVLPKKDQILSVILKRSIVQTIAEKDLQTLNECFVSGERDLTKVSSVNAGFIAIDVKRYVDVDFFSQYTRVYQYITKSNIQFHGEFIEQWILGYLQAVLGITYKGVNLAYNFRPGGIVIAEKAITQVAARCKNIHYSMACKPWLPVDWAEYVKIDVTRNDLSWFNNFLFFNEWIRVANTIPFVGFSYRKEEYTPFDIYLLFTNIKGALNAKIKNNELLHAYVAHLSTVYHYHFVPREHSFRLSFGKTNGFYEIAIDTQCLFSLHCDEADKDTLATIVQKNPDIPFVEEPKQGRLTLALDCKAPLEKNCQTIADIIKRTDNDSHLGLLKKTKSFFRLG